MAARNPESVINFAPGPAKIPAEVRKWVNILHHNVSLFILKVRKRVQDGIHSINGSGVGILGEFTACV